jgi:hypothetical protein
MEKMPNLNDVFLSIMASFIGFGLVIGIAQAAFDFGGGRSLLLSSPVFAQVLPTDPGSVQTPDGVILLSEMCPEGQVFYAGAASSTHGCKTGSCPTGYIMTNTFIEQTTNIPLYQCVKDNTDAPRGVTSCPAGQYLIYSRNYAPTTGYCVTGSTISHSLVQGWNIRSLQLEPSEPAIDKVLASISGQYTRITSFVNGSAVFYDPVRPTISTLKELHAGQGFMIFMKNTAVLKFDVNQIYPYKYPTNSLPSLSVGWNFVGPMSAGSVSATSVLPDINNYIIYTLVHNSPDAASEANKVYYPRMVTFTPGVGYWIKKLSDTEMAAKTAESNKYLNVECVANAVGKRDDAILAGMDTYASTLRNLVMTRERDLKSAWQVTDRKARRTEITKVWNKYKTDIKYMQKRSNSLKGNAWKQYMIDRKACGTYATSDDYTSAGVDAGLQMFVQTN